MGCMGPSKDFAFQQGEKAYEEVLAFLKAKYGVVDESFMNFGPLNQKSLDRKLIRLRRSIQELIWESDCQTW